MAKPANARDDHPFTGPDFGFLQTLVDGDAGAKDRCGGAEIEIIRQAADEFRIGEAIFGEAAVDGITGILLARA